MVAQVPLSAAPAERPNILFILTDDMGYGDLGCYGSSQIKTPHIDRLAAAGVRFSQAYVSGNVCAPSRAGLLTGRYQQRFGFEHNLTHPKHVKPEAIGIPLDEVLISDRMQQLGYQTGMIGKWHVGQSVDGHHPNARGFDYFFGMLGGGHPYFPTPQKNDLLRNREKVTEIVTPYLTDWFTLEAIDFMERSRKHSGGHPWFLYLSYNTPHTPLQAKPEDVAAFQHIPKKGRQTYCAMQKCLDEKVGQLLAYLKKSGQLENTLIVLTNDNGGSVNASHALNAPLDGMKGMMLEGGIRVPMIMHWPGKLEAGKTYPHPVISLDLTPTFVGLAGGKVEEEMLGKGKRAKKRIRDGVDLMPYLRTNGQEVAANQPHQTLYWRMSLRGAAIRDGDWKLVQLPHHPVMLFDLSQDISEQNNLASKHPEKVAELIAKHHDWTETFESDPLWTTGPYWSRYNDHLYELDYQLTQP